MSNISISNLQSSGSEPFTDAENFMSEIPENELASITGGLTEFEMLISMFSNVIKSIGDGLTTIARKG
jgi:bacteriocin-like protein